ncbi:FAD-linked oxidase C-terminal domain-containing protein [Bifidobacterium apri]
MSSNSEISTAATQHIRDAICILQGKLPDDVLIDDPQAIRDVSSDHDREQSGSFPEIVLMPECIDQVSTIMEWADDLRIPVYTRGSGTGMGHLSDIGKPGVLLLTDRLNRIVEINSEGHYARVQAGVINADINKAIRRYGLYYAPDPASSTLSTIGGNIATNAGGFKCAKYGVTRDSLLSLKVVLPGGDVIDTGRPVMKNVAGLDLTSLFTGSEGQLGIIVEATIRLRPIVHGTSHAIVFLDSLEESGNAVSAVLRAPVQPTALEFMPVPYIQTYPDAYVPLVGDASWMLVATTDGWAKEHDLDVITKAWEEQGLTVARPTDEELETFFVLRKTGKARPEGRVWSIESDAAVPLDRFSELLIFIKELTQDLGASLFLLAHAGDGNVHVSIMLPRADGETELPDRLVQARRRLLNQVLDMDGTVTGEHGVGLELKDYLPRQLGERNLELQRTIRRVFDPHDILNPGKWLA